jgi:anti-sigma regulatory factor (Ser/Thr protein kinase)
MEKKFKRAMESLDEVFDFINGFVAANGIDSAGAFSINLAVEEIFTNMVKYNPAGAHDIAMALAKDQNDLTVVLTDFDAEPFDVTQTAEVDVTQSLEARPLGGLGLHLVKKMVDQVDYQYANRQSTITLIKHLEQ